MPTNGCWPRTWNWELPRRTCGAAPATPGTIRTAGQHRAGVRDHEKVRRAGRHRRPPLERILVCHREGLVPDFYFKTLHHDSYWSAHPKAHRRFMEMYEAVSSDHSEYHDNLFCSDHAETVAFMQDVGVPWIAFKVLAAGAIAPADGFQHAFAGGADFLCVGMFDFQVDEDAELTRRCVAETRHRARPWF